MRAGWWTVGAKSSWKVRVSFHESLELHLPRMALSLALQASCSFGVASLPAI